MLTVYRELIDYLADHVSPEDILAFRISDAVEEHAETLTEHNKEGRLTKAEQGELSEMIEFDSLLSHLKARALYHQKLSSDRAAE